MCVCVCVCVCGILTFLHHFLLCVYCKLFLMVSMRFTYNIFTVAHFKLIAAAYFKLIGA